ncbi:MAG: HAD-IIIA family hydrolase, partial [Oligoflexia bacterium]|nr:HAD-IIIA family hydrolase [Oligoflexia bacterium]
LNQAGFLVILATNQSGVARGLVQESNLKKINEIIIKDFKSHGATIHDVYYCPHPVDGGCSCRKPNAGMLEQAAKKHDIDLKKSWMVGDRMTDVECGRRASCRSVLLQNNETPPIDPAFDPPEHVTENILTAAQLILKIFKEETPVRTF